ncbi:MAG: T9SS type A sorting domain-containing protein, partial [Ignavibacteriota bacterium]
TPKLAAEYPYLRDTGIKISSTNELRWSQTGGYFITVATGYSAAAGVFGSDTVKAGVLKFRRMDNAGDLQSLILSQISPSRLLLTAAGRSQNAGAIWQYHDSSFGNKWGTGPTIMSAGKFEFFLSSDSNRLVAYPLDSSGMMTGNSVEGLRDGESGTFKIAIDQTVSKSPWFLIEGTNSPSRVSEGNEFLSELQVIPNPIRDHGAIRITLEKPDRVVMGVYDDLGREVASLVNGQMFTGSYDLPLNVSELPSGHYILHAVVGNKTAVRSMNVLK